MHVHFDIIQAVWTVGVVIAGFWAIRLGSAWAASHNVPLLGKAGALVQFGG